MQRGAVLFGKSNDFVMNPQSNYQGSRKNKDLNQGLHLMLGAKNVDYKRMCEPNPPH